MYLKDRAIIGIQWSAGARIAKQILQFVISIVLARLLTPKDFGLIAMIVVFTGFATLFSKMGFGAALIQRKKIEERHLSSIFWFSIFSGIVLTSIVLAAAPFIATFYNVQQLKIITMLISINFFIGSFTIVQRAILIRKMIFRRLGIIEIVTVIIAGGLAITLASLGFGVWSLVFQLIFSTTASTLMMWITSDWKPQFNFDKNSIKDLFGFSSNLLGFNIFNYWVRNADNLLIGKFLGSSELGIYSRAYSIMLMPLSLISATIGNVMFPVLSEIQNDKKLVKKIYLKTINVIALITFPMMLGLFTIADSFILTLLGQKWIDVIPILRLFTLLGMVQSIGATVGWIYNSQGRTDWQFRWGIAAGSLLILSIIIGVVLGTIMSVAICYATMSGLILLYPNFAIPGKLINMTFSEVISNVGGSLGCAIIMAAGVYLLSIVLPQEWPHWARLITQVPFGVIFYILLVHIFKLKAYLEVKELVKEQWSNHFHRIEKS